MNGPYEPRGMAWDLLHCHAPEIVTSGPAGTGKSIGCLYKMHVLADRVPGFRGLILRQTRESLTQSGLVTFEDQVVPAGHPCLKGPRRNFRQSYLYPNGSEIVVAGLDKPSKVMSTEYDVIYLQEAIEAQENAWESLTTRLGRRTVMPYSQLIADTNPDRPTHWLKQRCESGRTLMMESRHTDNPLLWDAINNRWTDIGRSYIARLDNLTGVRKQRLRFGRWVQAEGVVYDGWDAGIHVINRFPIPIWWSTFLVIDFGYNHPFVCQWWAMDPDGRLYLFREIYKTHTLVEDHAKAILIASKGDPNRPRAIICDHDAEDRATLERHLKMPTVAAQKEVSPGIQCVASRLKIAGDGKPRLFVMRDSIVSRDELLIESKLPIGFVAEVDGYVWDTRNNRKMGEEPLKENDHGCDCARYITAHFDFKPRGTSKPRAATKGFMGR